MTQTETAYAKINLALHIRARRADGYHQLETAFAFVDAGDALMVAPAEADRVETYGEFATLLDRPADNIVAKALALLPRALGWRVRLEKRLPVAAGLGGGSADAGALFRLIEREYGLPDDWPALAARLGADVPACVRSEAVLGHGIGTDLTGLVNDLAGCPVLLVNPLIPLSTGPVFKGWDGTDRGAMPKGTAREIALAGRNDLEAPAVALCPAIADVLAVLQAQNPWCARMSGSGATCFALYDSVAARDEAAASIRADWWHMTGLLR